MLGCGIEQSVEYANLVTELVSETLRLQIPVLRLSTVSTASAQEPSVSPAPWALGAVVSPAPRALGRRP